VRDLRAADLAQLRGAVDDATGAAVKHLPEQRAGAQKSPAQVDREHPVPIGDRHVLDQRLGEDTGVMLIRFAPLGPMGAANPAS